MSAFPPQRFMLSTARRTAERVVEELAPMCDRIEIAGSIRRGRPQVGDIDLVVLPKPGLRDQVLIRANQKTSLVKAGEQYAVLEMATGLQLDLWFAHGAIAAKEDMFGTVESPARPGNFGMLLLTRTGSALHNVYLANQARSLGLHFHPHQGITSAGRVIASETEEDVFRALKLPFVAPEQRER